ncbi:MAG: hypothetical protein IPK83_00295 [Planctomycetes bacterium]|nr:hypothetical protein [Planctomycetota bacterium]
MNQFGCLLAARFGGDKGGPAAADFDHSGRFEFAEQGVEECGVGEGEGVVVETEAAGVCVGFFCG